RIRPKILRGRAGHRPRRARIPVGPSEAETLPRPLAPAPAPVSRDLLDQGGATRRPPARPPCPCAAVAGTGAAGCGLQSPWSRRAADFALADAGAGPPRVRGRERDSANEHGAKRLRAGGSDRPAGVPSRTLRGASRSRGGAPAGVRRRTPRATSKRRARRGG